MLAHASSRHRPLLCLRVAASKRRSPSRAAVALQRSALAMRRVSFANACEGGGGGGDRAADLRLDAALPRDMNCYRFFTHTQNNNVVLHYNKASFHKR